MAWILTHPVDERAANFPSCVFRPMPATDSE